MYKINYEFNDPLCNKFKEARFEFYTLMNVLRKPFIQVHLNG